MTRSAPQPLDFTTNVTALIVGAFYQVETYLQLLPSLSPEDRGQLADGDVRWLDRCLASVDADGESPARR